MIRLEKQKAVSRKQNTKSRRQRAESSKKTGSKKNFLVPSFFFLLLSAYCILPTSSAYAMARRPPVEPPKPAVTVEASAPEIPALKLGDLIEEALGRNPELYAFREKWKAAKARVWQAMSWDDTNIGADFEGIPHGRIGADRNTDIEWTVSQKIPFPGKRFLRGRVAAKEAKMAQADFFAKEKEIVSEVKKAYSEVALRENEFQNHHETKQVLERLAQSAESRYATGQVSYSEVLKIHTELSVITNDIAKHHQQRETALARLSLLLGRNATEPLRIVSEIPERNFSYTKEDLMKRALEHRPELRAMKYGVEAAKGDAVSAWFDLVPDGEFRIEARQFSGEGRVREYDQFYGFQVPVLSLLQRAGKIKEKRAEKRAAEGTWENMKNLVLFEVQEALAEYESNDRTVKMYEANVLPQSKSAVESALAEFESGKGNFLAALQAQKMLTDFRHEYFHSLAMREESFADLERAVGVELGGGISK